MTDQLNFSRPESATKESKLGFSSISTQNNHAMLCDPQVATETQMCSVLLTLVIMSFKYQFC